jgi:hypothetical protein
MTRKHPEHAALTPPDIEPPDPWHSHAGETERPQKPHGELANAHLIVFFGIGSFLIVLICAVAVYAYYLKYSRDLLNEAEFGRAAGLEKDALQYRRTAQADLVQGYAWADHEHVQLPIADAMQRVARQYAQRSGATPANPASKE